MDPNATLATLRNAIIQMDAAESSADLSYQIAAEELRDAAEALDDWLSKGGFLPDAWQHGEWRHFASEIEKEDS